MPSDYLERLRRDPAAANPLFARLGIVPVEIVPGRAVLELPFKPSLLQGAGQLAGGVQAAVLDEAMAHAVLATLVPHERTVTMDLHVRYLAAGGEDDLRVEAEVVKRGKRVVVAQGEVTAAGRTLSLGTASFMVLV